MFGRTVLVFIVVVSAPSISFSADLEWYVREGLSNNLVLKQIDISYRQSLEALQEAKGTFLPSISIEARYSRAGGGREIIVPIGDLMNPVYGTLNELLVAQGLPPKSFPTLENEITPFLREREQETKIRIVQPVFQPAIYYNYRIKSSLSRARRAEREAFKRQLVADIKTAYFNYFKTVRVAELLSETRALLEENLRISESLFKNRKATKDVVFRARAEISALEQDRAEAERDRRLAAAYFNFLLNRPRDAAIDPPEEAVSTEQPPADLESSVKTALQHREEIDQLGLAIEAAGNGVRLAGSGYLPSVNVVLDYGIQGEEYRFTDEDDFWMGSILFEWNLFDGFQKKARRDRAVLEKKHLETRFEQLRARIRLQVQEAYDNLHVARMGIDSARDRVASARFSFDIVRRKYREGMSPQIEFLDARNTLTSAEVSRIVAVYDYRIRLAEFERVTAAGRHDDEAERRDSESGG